jgi:hypothetical protein
MLKPGDEFKTIRVLVTPQMAKATISANKITNRRLNPQRVAYFVHLMKSGQFVCTHQGIALDSENNIIDGQHRLAAVVASGCCVYMMVSKNVPIDTMPLVDSGAPRTLKHRLELYGIKTHPIELAIARILEYGAVASTQNSLGFEDAIVLLEKYKDGVAFAVSNGGTNVHAPVLAVIARASYTVNPDVLKRFLEVYKTECPSDETETAPLKLKRFVMAMGGVNKGTPNNPVVRKREHIYFLTQSALHRFIKKERVKTLIAATSELFPLPE